MNGVSIGVEDKAKDREYGGQQQQLDAADQPAARKAVQDRFYQKHREAILTRQKQYRADNAETIKERKRKRDQENRDAIREYHRQYRALNAERIQIANAKYYQKHKEAINTAKRFRYRAEKENALSEEEKAERAEAKAERAKVLAEKAGHKRLRDENRKRLAEEQASIDREHVERLAEKERSISDRVTLLRQIARQKRLEGSNSKGVQLDQLSPGENRRPVGHLEKVVKIYLVSSKKRHQHEEACLGIGNANGAPPRWRSFADVTLSHSRPHGYHHKISEARRLGLSLGQVCILSLTKSATTELIELQQLRYSRFLAKLSHSSEQLT
ncbi:hypothetical protein KCU65_g434, partial [Aureobasidium melanogenum]